MDIVAYEDVKKVVLKALKDTLPEDDAFSVSLLTESVIDALDGEIVVVQREDEVFSEDDDDDDEYGADDYEFEEDLT